MSLHERFGFLDMRVISPDRQGGNEREPFRRASFAYGMVSVALIFICGACLASAPVTEDAQQEPDSTQVRLLDERLTVLSSRLDEENRYPSAVLVNGVNGVCSGVLIHPRLVLTAGHCVCVERRDSDKLIIDGSLCGEAAIVTTAVYEAPRRQGRRGPSDGGRDGGPTRGVLQDFVGKVRPHRDFKVLYDEQGRLVSFNTDLAVILLEKQVGGVETARLAETEVEVGESIVMVGYGYYENPGRSYGQRRFGRNEVAAVSHGLFQVRKPGSHFLGGDSGGPCFRESDQGAVLVGIMMSSSVRASSSSTFTSTYVHQKWLREQIQLADKAGSSAP